MATALHVLVRLVHVLGATVLLGGAAFTWNALRGPRDPRPLAAQYEWVFWGTLGVMFVTGVGNVGTLGAPAPATRWGALLTAKLSLVAAVVVGSFPRTLAALRLRNRDVAGERGTDALRRAYAATAAALVLVVALAEVLAHG